MSITNWLVGFKTVIVLSLSDFTTNSPSEFSKSVGLAKLAYCNDNEIGLAKVILYSIEFPTPIGTSLIKSPLFFGTIVAEFVKG